MILTNPVQEKLELQCNWPLTKDSVVVIAGAYTGTVARNYIERYGCHFYLFEPQTWAYATLVPLTSDKVKVFNYGLGIRDSIEFMREFGTDGASFLDVGQSTGQGQLFEAGSALPDSVDVFVCNMEGYEHLLIPYLIEKGLISHIKYILCQIHGGDREALNRLMNLTHKGGEWIPGGWALWERNEKARRRYGNEHHAEIG
jgi:hypothetical protein